MDEMGTSHLCLQCPELFFSHKYKLSCAALRKNSHLSISRILVFQNTLLFKNNIELAYILLIFSSRFLLSENTDISKEILYGQKIEFII